MTPLNYRHGDEQDTSTDRVTGQICGEGGQVTVIMHVFVEVENQKSLKLTQNYRNLIKNSYNLVQNSNNLIKNSHNLVQNSSNLVQNSSNLVKNSNNLVQNS
ncbi:hypothetical protein NL108_012886 [Boleophthalmus pectinirostris]|nr:hypothetical protein NL108_012886 [Boleophthalmus pectinirostris]